MTPFDLLTLNDISFVDCTTEGFEGCCIADSEKISQRLRTEMILHIKQAIAFGSDTQGSYEYVIARWMESLNITKKDLGDKNGNQ